MVRLLFLEVNPDQHWAYSIFYYGDSGHYHQYASSILKGLTYDNGIPYHPPFFAWFLAALYKLHGIPTSDGYVFKVWLAILNSLTVAVCWLWYRRSLSFGWSIAGAGILVFSFGWLVLSATLNNEVLYALFLAATAALVTGNSQTMSWKTVILLGLVMGLGSLTRAEHLSLWPVLVLYLWIGRSRDMQTSTHLLHWSASALISLLVILPWSVRNYRNLSAFNDASPDLEPLPVITTVSAYGPVNFALANHESADGGFNPDLINRFTGGASIDLNLEPHRYYFIHGYAEGMNWILTHRTDALKLLARKTDRWLDGLAIGFGVSDFPGGLAGSRAPVDLFVPDNRILKWLLFVLLVVGMVISFRRPHRPELLCSLILLHRFAVTLLFFGYARSLVVMLPVVDPLLLLPLRLLAARFPRTQRPAASVAAVAALVFLLEAVGAASGPTKQYKSSGSVDQRGRLIQDSRVGIRPAR